MCCTDHILRKTKIKGTDSRGKNSSQNMSTFGGTWKAKKD